jgi:site-specific recombinase
VILFSANMIGGWAENGFMLHRLDRRAVHHRFLGLVCSSCNFTHQHFRLRLNISLGFMLGLIPAVSSG